MSTDLTCIPDSEIRDWAADGSVFKKIAASLATDIKSGKLERYAEFPSSAVLARKWDTTSRTVIRAKRLLCDRGLAKKAASGFYYVA